MNAVRLVTVLVIVLVTFIPVAWIILTGFKGEPEYLHSPQK